ncbi:MAG: DNA-processing protein DprA [Pyrinomonadaceae bacterium]
MKYLSPAREMGAYESLWNDSVSSFKQVRTQLTSSNHDYFSEYVPEHVATTFFQRAQERLFSSGVDDYGVCIEGTADYPVQLKDAEHQLHLLYYRGIWDLVFSPGISVVGTRNPSSEGIRRTKRLVKELVSRNFTVFSGLARGVDSVAHRTAIENKGKTVAVIGTPLSRSYPPENRSLQEEIAKRFLVISQVPVIRYESNGPSFNRFFFPERNITMSALTLGTIIVEAGEGSGTLTQARAALKQGRKLFILDNNFKDPNLKWPNKLLNQGAIRVQSMDDFDKVMNCENTAAQD